MTVLFVFTIRESMGGEVLAASTLRKLEARATLALRHLARGTSSLIAQGLSGSREVFYLSHEGAEGSREVLDTSFRGSYTSREGFHLIDEG
ncbi:hypothetical protein ACXR0O_03275 [Verrucomicrobiota bacterium sgz303538]